MLVAAGIFPDDVDGVAIFENENWGLAPWASILDERQPERIRKCLAADKR